MLTLHYMDNSRAFRILWLLEELKALYGTPYELIKHSRNKNNLAPAELKKIHPMGKAPILVDNDKAMIESGFIIEYLLKNYDSNHTLSPNDDEWDDYTFWLHFGESSVMPPLVMRLVFAGIVVRSPFFIRPITKGIKNNIEKMWLSDTVKQTFDLLENALEGKHYLAGKFTAADIQVYFGAKAVSMRGGLGDYPNIKNWLARCEARTAHVQACQLGGALSF
ncbi:MAG: glutathione S-transferase [Moraxella sp.]|nr:glutathione S-transferase [Moraxella sp.]